MTRSPAAKPVTPAPTLSTMPANSAAGENGKAGLYLVLAGDDQRVEEIQRRGVDSHHRLARARPPGRAGRAMVEIVGRAGAGAEQGFHGPTVQMIHMGSRRPAGGRSASRDAAGATIHAFTLPILPIISLYLDLIVAVRRATPSRRGPDEADDTKPTCRFRCSPLARLSALPVRGGWPQPKPAQPDGPGHAARPVRRLGRLYGDARRQEGLLRAGQADRRRSTNPPNRRTARSGLSLHLDPAGGEGEGTRSRS